MYNVHVLFSGDDNITLHHLKGGSVRDIAYTVYVHILIHIIVIISDLSNSAYYDIFMWLRNLNLLANFNFIFQRKARTPSPKK